MLIYHPKLGLKNASIVFEASFVYTIFLIHLVEDLHGGT